jgi:perosamine synthetase
MSKLAIDGGAPVRTRPPIVETDVFEEEELQALLKVAQQKKLRRAEATLEYDKSLADWFGVKHAIAVSSGTTSLHIAGRVRLAPRRGYRHPYTSLPPTPAF